MSTRVFIHGLESSSRGTKAAWFKERYPDMLVSDYSGDLAERLARLEEELAGMSGLILIGSSFGGLMATIYAMEHEARVRRLILLAPALNFPGLAAYRIRHIQIPVHVFIGENDTVTPPDLVAPVARDIFSCLFWQQTADDHLLRSSFAAIPWDELLN